MNNKKLTITDYGMYLLSFDSLKNYLKSNKIRSKKVLNYFQKNQNEYIKSIEKGVWLPIVPIDSIKYIIKVDESFNSEWIEINKENEFNLEIGNDNSLWIGSFSDILTIDAKSFENNLDDYKFYETLDGVTIYDSFRFNIPKGKYLVNIKGYKRKEKLEYPEANFGFLFELNEVENFDGFKDPREDEKYSFNIAQM